MHEAQTEIETSPTGGGEVADRAVGGDVWKSAKRASLGGSPKSLGKMIKLKTLDEALNLCAQIADCGGVTYHDKLYELRQGKQFQITVNIDPNDVSWLKPGNGNFPMSYYYRCYPNPN